MTKLNLAVEATSFLDYLSIEKGCSALTVKNYRSHLQDLMVFLQGKELTLDSVRAYRTYLANKNLTKGSQNVCLVILRSFIKYLIRAGKLVFPLDTIELIKTAERQLKILTTEQIKILLQQPNIHRLSGLRDRAILELLFATGLRVAELCSLNRADINFVSGEFTVLGKGGRVRPIFLSLRAVKWLKNYLMRRRDTDPALFVTWKGQKSRVKVRSVQRLVKGYAARSGLTDKLTPHGMRHLFACDLLANGADLRSIQELLGHKNIATTQIYTHITNSQLKRTYLKFHGKEIWT